MQMNAQILQSDAIKQLRRRHNEMSANKTSNEGK